MNEAEFRQEFLEQVKTTAAVSGEGSCAAFVQLAADYLIEAEVLPDFYPSYYQNTAGTRKMRVDGYAFDELDLTLNLIIADYEPYKERSLTKTDASALFRQLLRFVDGSLNSDLYKNIEISTPCADLVDTIRTRREDIRRYRFFIFTDASMSSRIKELDELEIDGVPVECQIWDIDRIFNVCSSSDGREQVEIDFTSYIKGGIPCLKAGSAAAADKSASIEEGEDFVGDYQSYLCMIPGSVLADIYDQYGSQLLESNVRSFLTTKVAVNKKIRTTILTAPEMFFAYNNGVSAIAKNLKFEKTSDGLYLTAASDFQIINGGQTTASLSTARLKDKASLNHIYVQMKLTEINEAESERSEKLIENISRSSNSQNKVSEADFFASHPFHRRMEQISRRIFAPAKGGVQYNTKWFYERARGQYVQSQARMTPAQQKQFKLANPKKQVITKTDLAKFRNSWNGLPHIVSKGAQNNFTYFARLIDEKWKETPEIFNELYYTNTAALGIIFKHLEDIIPRQSWYENGYRANIVTYSMAMLHKLIQDQCGGSDLDLGLIWQQQEVPKLLSDVLTLLSEKIFKTITDPHRGTANVTEWCKQEKCWESVQKINLTLPESFSELLLSRRKQRSAESAAKKDQKMLSGVEAVAEVFKYKAAQWVKLRAFMQEHSLINSPKEQDALKAAGRISSLHLPTEEQSMLLLALLQRAQEEGFSF
ncbi:MAG: AIPR family protein [Proteobacteria bacterium]|uniref:AIPR family protein n=1 Tax=Candidatus Avisuccinivibrio stercorigallinarum TaxID=2840704 RepID=A0A9D9DBR3_9GAMM|nr:AIPR family protein [Candidatus Avisuccinivibrio stercorigallinarum]